MSVLRVYLNWVNSVLSDTGKQVEGITELQKGEIFCQLIDILNPGAKLHYTVTTGGEGSAVQYLDQVISYLNRHGIHVNLTSQDIYAGDVKSILDLLWAIILNFTIHNPRRSIEKRTIRNGKKLSLKWCCKQLPSGVWNLRKTVTNNLCSHENFSQLLQQFCGSVEASNTEDKEGQLSWLLSHIELKYKIKGEIIRPKQLLECTIEEHDLLIYLSLLRWRIGDSPHSDSSSDETDIIDSRLRGTTAASMLDCSSSDNTQNHTHVPLSVMLKGYANEDDSSRNFVNKMSERRNVTFSAENEHQLGYGLTNNSTGKTRLSRPSSAPTSRFSSAEVSNTPKSNSGRFVRSFSPSRYAKSFEIPPDKKQELEIRSGKINGQTSHILTSPLDNHFNDTNGFSEDTSDWLSSDMESQGVADKSLIKDTINLKVKEVVTGCDEMASENDKSKDSYTQNSQRSNPSNLHNTLAGTNIPSLMGYHNGVPHSNFKIPVGGLPLFGMTPGAPVTSGIGGGVPLFLLPGHSPEVAHLLEALQQQQLARQTLADSTDGAVSLGDASHFETSGQISEGDYTESSNIGDEMSSSSELRGKFEKSHSQDSSEAELKHLGGSGAPSEDRLQSYSRESRSTDPQRLRDSGCESQSRPGSSYQGYKIEEDESLKKIRLLRESLQKPVEEERLGDRSMGSDDLHMDDLSCGRRRHSLPERYESDTKTSQPRHFTKLAMAEGGDYGLKHNSPTFSRDKEQHDKALVQQLTEELKHLKSKVLTLERSQESSGDDSIKQQERYRNSERSRLPRGPPRRLACESPPRSLLRSPEHSNLSSVEANKRARDTVSDLLITMQSPLSRKKADEQELSVRSSRDFNPQPLHGFGRSLSEDRLHGNKSRRETYHAEDDWRSRSFHSGFSNKEREIYHDGRSRSLQDLSGRKIPTGILTDDELIVKPPSATPINYGYSSPIQKVSSDIWGVNMKDMDNLEPGRQAKWKRLTEPKMFMTDSDIIELKQCLASATMENEILHAKVGNASLDIGEKMTKMAQVLEETKLSLIKTQAENEELHTQLDRERSRSDTLEVRVADLEASANKARSECERLQNELEEARILLGGTNADGIHMVEQENYQLKRQLHLTQQDQRKSKEELENMKVSRNRAHSAVKDLHAKLDDTREENQILSREINEVKTQERSYRTTATLLTRAADIKDKLFNREEKIHQPNTEHTSNLHAERLHSHSPATPSHPYTTSTPYSKSNSPEPFMTSSPSRGKFTPRAVSPTQISPVKNYPSRPKSYNFEEISPAVQSRYKEIYPHRRGRTAALRTRDAFHESLTPGEDRHRKWSLTGQLNYSDCDLGESQAEKPYSDGYTNGLPPHPDSLRDSQSSYTSRSKQDRNRSYAEEIQNLKSHLSRSYHGEDTPSLQRSCSRDSSLQRNVSGLDHSYHGKPGYEWETRTPQGRPLSDVTPQKSYRASGRSPLRSNGTVRGILKPASSDQDLRKIGRNSPASRRSASPNVTFNTEVASRAISPQSTISRNETIRRLRGQSGLAGVPLFGVPSRRYGIVRNLNDEFEDEEPVRDCDSHQVQGLRAKTWFENKNSCESPVLTTDQRHYADLLIDKYLHGRMPYLGSTSPSL